MGRRSLGRAVVTAVFIGLLWIAVDAIRLPAAADLFAPMGGDSSIGKALFTGARRFQSGGPACMACHSTAALGPLGGGALGPDLTQVYDRYGEKSLASILNTLPFPTMRPVYQDKPLTAEEQAHLLAFFRQAAGERPSGPSGVPIALGGLGAAVLLGLAGLVWRRRLTGVRSSIARGGTT